MDKERKAGIIRRLDFKRTWGIIADLSGEDYVFEMNDIDLDAFALREGLPITFIATGEENTRVPGARRARDVQVQ